jgi:3-deoxy-manno-octulosonate cytidylyltransferase (CMP-KDO synthetase)
VSAVDLVVIPCRMGSSRYPGKPLAMINGEPMVQLIVRRVLAGLECYEGCRQIKIVVATCDAEIEEAVHEIGSIAEVLRTSIRHDRASDRTQEAVCLYEQTHGVEVENVIMVQGDEPCVLGEFIVDSIKVLDQGDFEVTNIGGELTVEDLGNRNIIKMICSLGGVVQLFSRVAPLESAGKNLSRLNIYKQVCIIGFTRRSLNLYSSLEPTATEMGEAIDMSRFLDHDVKICAIPTDKLTHPVDVPTDISIVESILFERV